MAILSADQRELFLPLVEGIHESPPFGAFMRNLVARTYARRAFMILTLANAGPAQQPSVIHVAAPRAAHEPPLDFRRLDALRLHPYGALRPERVYALDEMLDYDRPAQLAHQRAALDEMGIRYGRWLRVSAGGVADAWLLLVREREDFSAAAVATLAGIAPHLAAALRTLVALIDQRLQATMAQRALARLGIGQLAFDGLGRVMAADPVAELILAFTPEPGPRPGRRLQLLPETTRALDAACAELAEAEPGAIRLLRLDERTGRDLLLRKADLDLSEPAATPAVIGTLRLQRRESAAAGAAVLAAEHGLSPREAALAQAISAGQGIIEAGEALGLTSETARNYSKRIYAKTATSGQADLVRLVLAGLTPLA
ncbi:LuxR family transcriptional regulator [Novosphingobium sp. FKTRR1]|uniref:helix-turn-helix transcriptional regulator n=1 Tax=Novosphingobium sp. FKTRR1 TaxID=2879118 RepID=UPI001CEFDF4D|nr:LuxR family transcriptional regulator [Novosphingobium sp. FKTRR1]